MAEKVLDLQLFATPVQPTGNAHISTSFGKLLEPGLRKIFFETYDEVPEAYGKIFHVEKSEKAQEKDWGMGAFGDWEQRASETSEVSYKKLSAGLDRVYTHKAFTQGFMVGRELYDDDQYRQINKMPAAMARSGRQKVEKDAVTLLLNGFKGDVSPAEDAFRIYDNKALFSTAHPLIDSAKLGVNKLDGALTGDNLKKALQLMQEIPDEAGNLTSFVGTKLIIPPALEDTAIRVTNSDKVAGSNFNDTNKYLNGYGLEIVVNPFLSAAAGGSDVQWYVQDGKRHQMNFFWRKRPEFKWDEDFDTFVAKYRGYMRYSFGVSDWRGIVGSTGV